MRRRRKVGLAATLAMTALVAGVLVYGPSGEDAPAQETEPAAAAASTDSPGETARSVARLLARVEARPNDLEALESLGQAYEQRARETADSMFYAKAENAYRRALAVDRASYAATAGLASVAASHHQFREALRFARDAVALRPDAAQAYGILGDALVELGRYDAGFAAFERMAALEPNLASYTRIAYARELLGRPRAALEALGLAVDAGSGSREHLAWTIVQTGNLLFETGRLGAAAAAYHSALEYVPGYVEAEGGLARIAAARGRWEVAIARFQSVVDARPDPGHVAELGDVLQAAGQPAEARRAWQEAVALESSLRAAGRPDEPEMILFAVDRGHDPERALERARRLHARAPSIEAEDALAWALYANERCREARSHSVRALQLGTRDALMLFHRGMIERCLGSDGEARRFLRRALEANPHFSLRHAETARALAP